MPVLMMTATMTMIVIFMTILAATMIMIILCG
jgi:hypothetical protein